MPSADLLPGTLDLLVLKAVSLGPLHGLGVARRIEQLTERNVSGETGIAVPRSASHGRARLAGLRMGRLRDQSQGEILPAHEIRTAAAGNGSEALGPGGAGDGARPGGGMKLPGISAEAPRTGSGRRGSRPTSTRWWTKRCGRLQLRKRPGVRLGSKPAGSSK